MQETSSLYKRLLADPGHWKEYTIVIGESGVLVTNQGDRITFGSKPYRAEVRGSVIQFEGTTENPLTGLTILGKTVQNGTPTPDAPVALETVGADGSVAVTVCGKNLFAEGAVYWGVLERSVARLALDYPATSPVTRPAWSGVGIRVPVLPNTTYTVSTDANPCNYFMLAFYKDMKDVGSASKKISYIEKQNTNVVTFTTPDECNCVVALTTSKTETEYSWTWWQVEHGSVATAYEPYKDGGSLTISTPNGLPGIPVASGGNYTDENGQQWICDEVDFEKGVYVQRVVLAKLTSTMNWKYSSSTNRFYTVISNAKADYSYRKFIGLCSHYPAGVQDKNVAISYINEGNEGVAIRDESRFSGDMGAFKAWLDANDVWVLLQAKEQRETALSAEQLAAFALLHTNCPNTTVFNDKNAGMEVKYVADTKLYIDKKFEQLAAAMLNN